VLSSPLHTQRTVTVAEQLTGAQALVRALEAVGADTARFAWLDTRVGLESGDPLGPAPSSKFERA
jgi:hypothetical protein